MDDVAVDDPINVDDEELEPPQQQQQRQEQEQEPPPSMTTYRLDGVDVEMEAAPSHSASAESRQWMTSLERCIRAIVSIRLNSVRAFDGNGASFSVASGFVVDMARGIILTNRHVVTPGPVVADAIFLNKEEVDLVPIYRYDHDCFESGAMAM
ncbi:hypothetical protein PINS_up010822 [Pythium insidiosum]|nr:hypothetical protein PINS_up010822 [Pythium insidiosum]